MRSRSTIDGLLETIELSTPSWGQPVRELKPPEIDFDEALALRESVAEEMSRSNVGRTRRRLLEQMKPGVWWTSSQLALQIELGRGGCGTNYHLRILEAEGLVERRPAEESNRPPLWRRVR